MLSLFLVTSQAKAQNVNITEFYGVKEAENVYSSCGYMANLQISFYANYFDYYEVEKSTNYLGPFTAIGGQEGGTRTSDVVYYSFTWQDYNFCQSAYYRIKFYFLDHSYRYSNTIQVVF